MIVTTPSGNRLIFQNRPRRITFNGRRFPTPSTGFSDTNFKLSIHHGGVIYSARPSSLPFDLIYVMFNFVDHAFFIDFLEQEDTFVPPNAPFSSVGWSWNFVGKHTVFDVLTAAQWASY